MGRCSKHTHAANCERQTLGKTVTLAGWVHRRRDHGGVIFIDLRDRFGAHAGGGHGPTRPIPRCDPFKTAETLRSEFVVQVEGVVQIAPGRNAQPRMATGDIEVVATCIVMLNPAKVTPFPDRHATGAMWTRTCA